MKLLITFKENSDETFDIKEYKINSGFLELTKKNDKKILISLIHINIIEEL